jgi:hypothetical protein
MSITASEYTDLPDYALVMGTSGYTKAALRWLDTEEKVSSAGQPESCSTSTIPMLLAGPKRARRIVTKRDSGSEGLHAAIPAAGDQPYDADSKRALIVTGKHSSASAAKPAIQHVRQPKVPKADVREQSRVKPEVGYAIASHWFQVGRPQSPEPGLLDFLLPKSSPSQCTTASRSGSRCTAGYNAFESRQ